MQKKGTQNRHLKQQKKWIIVSKKRKDLLSRYRWNFEKKDENDEIGFCQRSTGRDRERKIKERWKIVMLEMFPVDEAGKQSVHVDVSYLRRLNSMVDSI